MNRLYIYILNTFWIGLILISFFINPLFSIAIFWFGLTILGFNRFQNKNYNSIKKILWLRMISMLFFILVLVLLEAIAYYDYDEFYSNSYKKAGLIGAVISNFKGNVIYSTLVPLLFILNLINLIYTSKQKYQYTKLLGAIEIAAVLIFIIVGFIHTFI